MADHKPASRRPAPATIALIVAGLLALGALGYRFWPGGGGGADSAEPGNASANAAGAPAGDMEAMIAALSERVRQDPDNHRGWFELGFLLRNTGRYMQAEQAFRRAAELAPDNADYLAYRGEILLILARRDNVPPEAEQLFRRVLALQPGNPQARFYLATIRDIKGDHRGAVDDLIALLRDAPAGASWEPQVRTSLAAIAREHDIDIAGRLPPPPAAPPPSVATAGIPGPSREQMEQARAIPPGEQDAMVRSMVDRLAGRLRQNPRNADGWIQLIRSRMVLRDPDAAREALRSGLAAFNGDAATQGRLRQAARELGVPAG